MRSSKYNPICRDSRVALFLSCGFNVNLFILRVNFHIQGCGGAAAYLQQFTGDGHQSPSQQTRAAAGTEKHICN
ncbi:hypothetical protein CHARACLAT_024788 [Characodon lateralis]|uniref:Uncharacterized protein n=1 Tax=Characodon lateralis TaxID=208331 RepID=A0ABU7E386_9TELE|nr:hypothetical protein [Characodon lateralis]